MQLTAVHIKNFRYIRDISIDGIENALILVGRNSSGKTGILHAVRTALGSHEATEQDFNEKGQNIEISVTLSISQRDLELWHENGTVSQYKRFETWKRDFAAKLPSYQDSGVDGGSLTFTFIANRDGRVRYADGCKKNNRYLPEIFPKIYFMDTGRDLRQIQEDILSFQEDSLLNQMRKGSCMFSQARQCSHCFRCIGLIDRKTPEQLNAFETAKLLEYKLYRMNLDDFSGKVNRNFHKNGGLAEEIRFILKCDTDSFFRVESRMYEKGRGGPLPVEQMGKGMRSIYMLSLLEAYVEGEKRRPALIMMEDPEIFLHPRLQKVSSEILCRLSKKNQVLFSTHSPNLLFQFNSRQIRQTFLDESGNSGVRETADIGRILDDLGYTANDLMDVSFVFIVEGKQDKSRLPLLLEKYYSEIYNGEGKLNRIAIITTNSCTNIKTYANLKYMNRIYLRDQFLMIRDGDGENPEELAGKLCRYYDERNQEDADKLPKVTRRNVLILKYYSFENYFLNPDIMEKVGVLTKASDFYDILYGKWKEYLYRIRSGRRFTEALGRELQSPEDLKMHMEEFKIHVRGHNIYDIFYGPFKEKEKEILTKYIELAPREEFSDILDAADRFIYFDNRKK